MRSYENSGYNPYNDNYRSETRGSGRNYYTSDEYGLGNTSSRDRSSYSNRAGGFGSGRDSYADSGYGHTSTYGRSAGTGYGSSSSDYNRPRTGWTGSSGDSYSGRDTWDRAGDEVKSWFGDDDAERRRRMDEMRDRGSHDYRSSYNRGYSSPGSSYSSSSYSSPSSYGGSTYGTGSSYGTGSTYGTGYSTGLGSSGYGSTSSDRYTSGSYDRDRYSSNYDRDRDRHDRGFFDRAGDEVKSWFGDEEAERRRRMDEMRDRSNDEDYNRYGSSSSYRSSGSYSGPPYSYGSSSRRDYEW